MDEFEDDAYVVRLPMTAKADGDASSDKRFQIARVVSRVYRAANGAYAPTCWRTCCGNASGFLRAQAMLLRMLLPVCVGFASAAGMAQDCGWSRIDHRVEYDDSGAWNPDVYRSIAWAFTVAQGGAALWEGSGSRFGRTLWQGVDAQIIASVTASIGKRVFTRVRPTDANKPMPVV